MTWKDSSELIGFSSSIRLLSDLVKQNVMERESIGILIGIVNL